MYNIFFTKYFKNMNVLFYGCALSNLDNAAAQQLCKTTNPMEKSLFIPVVNKCILSTYTLHGWRHILVHIVLTLL